MTPNPTVEQWAQLETYVLTIPELASLPHWPQDDPEDAHQVANNYAEDTISNYLNTKSTGFYIWKESVSLDTIYDNGLDWTLVDNLTIGKARIWEWLFRNTGMMGASINATKANVRAGIEECWKGTTAMLAQRAVILGHCKTADITHGERGMAIGTGSLESPAVRTGRGFISASEIEAHCMRTWWG